MSAMLRLPAISLQYCQEQRISNRRAVATKTKPVYSIIRKSLECQAVVSVLAVVSQRSSLLPLQALQNYRGHAGLPAPILLPQRLCSDLLAWVHHNMNFLQVYKFIVGKL